MFHAYTKMHCHAGFGKTRTGNAGAGQDPVCGKPQKVDRAGRNYQRWTSALQDRDRGSHSNGTFVLFVRALRLKKVARMNRASTHEFKIMKEKLGANKNLKIVYLPKASPCLDVSEHLWAEGNTMS